MILAIDFDNTITKEPLNFPIPGELRKGAKKYINKLYTSGCRIIIWTCRGGEDEVLTNLFLRNNGFLFSSLNKRLDYDINYITSEKVYADIYIDDRDLFSSGKLPWWLIYIIVKIKMKRLIRKKIKSANIKENRILFERVVGNYPFE